MAVADWDDAADRLRKIESVTDSALAHLSSATLLGELLVRTRELLHADTATMLLLDPSGRQLVAVAAVGIEEVVRQGVRIPVGRGFAGTIAAQRKPIVIDHVDETTVLNPLLWERGLRVLAGVPLLVEGELLGVLHVGSVTQRPFTDDDLHLLQLVGDRLALAAHTQVSAVERAAAAALQNSLLPGVVGHGLAAAVVMGRLRSALRAYALDVDDPGEVLHKLNRKAHHFEYGAMATVSYAVIDRHHRQVTMALAGHPPPVLAEAGGTGTLMERPVGPPIGFPTSDRRWPSSVLELHPGALLCFYTDGLVERRDSTIDAGLRRLCATVGAAEPEAVCARVMAVLVGAEAPRDDVAMLVVRCDG
jgi:putative methionine-R-sulfoxide reductase with GAF domain